MYEYENRLVGILLGYFRESKSKTDPRFSRKVFVSWKSIEVKRLCKTCNKSCAKKDEICTLKTNRTIEKGETVKNVCFYIDFSTKLGFQYSMNQLNIDILTHAGLKLIQLIKTNNKNDWEAFRLFLTHHYDNYKKYIYFSQMFEIYIAFVEFMMNQSLPDDYLIHLMETIYPHLEEHAQFIVAYFLYKVYAYYKEDKKKKEFYLRIAYFLDSSNIELLLLSRQLDLTTYELYQYLCSFSKEKLNSFELFTLHRLFTECYIILGQSLEASEHSDICLKIATAYNEELAIREQYFSYCLKGVVFYHLKDYHSAMMFFKKVFYYDVNLLFNDFVLFMNCLEQLKKTDEIQKLLNREAFKKITVDSVKRLFKYYQQKYHTQYTSKELQSYILEELTDVFDYTSSHYQLIKEDMLEFCEISKNYKPLFLLEHLEKQR